MEDKYNKNQGYQEKIKQRFDKKQGCLEKIKRRYNKNQVYLIENRGYQKELFKLSVVITKIKVA